MALTTYAPSDGHDTETFRYVTLSDIQLKQGFWRHRIVTNAKRTIPAVFDQCELTGRLRNFNVAAGIQPGQHEGFFFNDSDVYKAIEGAAYSLMLQPDPKLEEKMDQLIDRIAAAQQPDGYLNTYYTIAEPDRKWSDIQGHHELYCAGHLLEAAVAYYHATGKRNLLDVAVRFADCIDDEFGLDKRTDPPGHEEIEIGLVMLYRETSDDRYLNLAEFFLNQRGQQTRTNLYGSYAQDAVPVADQKEALGHAVRAVYLYIAMADVAELTGSDEYRATLDRIWNDVVSKKMYLTGGLGASRAGEAFGKPYELGNASAYAETCAAIANALWNARMFELDPDHDGKYLDILERVIYNGFLSGVSISGDRFFYPNPLASDGITPFNHGSATRNPWFACACCPPNVTRFVPSIARFMYAMDDEANKIFVNLYAANEATLKVGETTLYINQTTRYPWDGRIVISIDSLSGASFNGKIKLRIPGWAVGHPVPGDLYSYEENDQITEEKSEISIKRNGRTLPVEIDQGFIDLPGPWHEGDSIELNLPMPIQRVIARNEVEDDRGRVALERGPIVYCIEGADFPDDDDNTITNVVLNDDATLQSKYEPEMLGGIETIVGAAQRVVRLKNGSTNTNPVAFRAIPYYAWGNRTVGEMECWIARTESTVPAPPIATIASQSHATASHCFASDTVRALNDQILPTSSADHKIPRHTWWPHKGTTEWVQYDFAEAQTVSRIEVYWFDDTGFGGCRIPESFRLLYRDERNTWQLVNPVKPTGPQTAQTISADQFNIFEFSPVRTTSLRLEAQLQPEFSAGVIEWRVE